MKKTNDTRILSHWLLSNVSSITSQRQANAWASLIVNRRDYDRGEPIIDNRIDGVEFDIPAPATLEAQT